MCDFWIFHFGEGDAGSFSNKGPGVRSNTIFRSWKRALEDGKFELAYRQSFCKVRWLKQENKIY